MIVYTFCNEQFIVRVKHWLACFISEIIWLASDNILYGQMLNNNCLRTENPFFFHDVMSVSENHVSDFKYVQCIKICQLHILWV